MTMMFCIGLQAQTGKAFRSQALTDRIVLGLDCVGVTGHGGHRQTGLACSLGYEFVPCLYAFARWESLVGLHDVDGAQTYTNTGNLGGGLGFRLFTASVRSSTPSRDNGIDIYATMMASVGNSEWKQTAYETGLKWRLVKGLSPTLGLGFRHTNSHTAGIPNHNGLVASLGIRF